MMVMTGLQFFYPPRIYKTSFFSALTRTTFRFEKLASSLKVSDDELEMKKSPKQFFGRSILGPMNLEPNFGAEKVSGLKF